MSYDPSQAAGAKAIQIDVNGSTVLSDDVTAHTSSSITARCKYYIESKYFITITGTGGRIQYQNWAGFVWAGGTIRCSSATSGSSMTDDIFVGSNTPGTSLSMQSSSVGAGNIVAGSSSMMTMLWRIT